MRTPDWWGWNDWPDPEHHQPVEPNQEHLIRRGLTVSACLFFASLYPTAVVPAILGGFLILAAVGAAARASATCRARTR